LQFDLGKQTRELSSLASFDPSNNRLWLEDPHGKAPISNLASNATIKPRRLDLQSANEFFDHGLSAATTRS